MSVQALSHAQKVTRLYRKHLKNMLSWTVERDVWRQDACELRGIFDEHKNTDMGTAVKLLEEGEKLYHRHKHPAPYIHPEAPGGTKWERNFPPPPQVLELLPEEKKWLEEWQKYGPK